MTKKGYTLTEVLIVLIIIAILAALGLVNYQSAKEKAIDREAIANLKLIQAAEKIYRIEIGSYYPGSGSTSTIGDINQYLKLYLPTAASPNWTYAVYSTGCSCATRNATSARYYTYAVSNPDEPTATPSCSCP